MSPVPKQTQTRKGPKPIISRFSRWFRFYTDVVDDPKCQRLHPYTFKAWVNLLALAGNHEGGHLPAIEDIAFKLRMRVEDVQAQINILIDVGLIDIVTRSGDTLTLQPHNWAARQYKSDSETSAERTRKWREKKAAKAEQHRGNASATLQERPGDVPGDVSVTSQRHFDSESESALQGSASYLPCSKAACDADDDQHDDALGAYNPADDDDEVPL